MTVMDRIKRKDTFTYDNRFDVLRVFFKPAKAFYAEEVSDGFYVQYDEETDEVVGLLIMDFKKRKQLELIKLSPVKVDFRKMKLSILKGKY